MRYVELRELYARYRESRELQQQQVRVEFYVRRALHRAHLSAQ